MNKDEIIAELFDGMQDLDEERVMKAVAGAAGSGVTFDEAVNEGLALGIRKIGDRFESGELFLPHLVMAGDLMDAAVEKLSGVLSHQGEKASTSGTVVIGTVKDDIHEIGKNIVALMLRVSGFKVIDVGVDVPISDFINAAESNNARIIGTSALLTTTQFEQRRLVEQLESLGLRDKYKVLVGGGQVTEAWRQEIGADGYGKDANAAVRVAVELVKA
ncbi:MAG: cobalamin-dependent protein [Spirochaetaceae bacterium]|nr:MAG: cobalamin-dependent protein [Spirochaetaceae bacterium]